MKKTEREKRSEQIRRIKHLHYKQIFIDLCFFVSNTYEKEGRNSNQITATEIIAFIQDKLGDCSRHNIKKVHEKL
jgi:hypothetical protein